MKTDRKRHALRGACAVLLLFTAACGGDSAGPRVTSVTVSPLAPSVLVGQSTQLSATVRDQNGNPMTGRTVTWNSEAQGVATVSGGGLVTGVAPGTARITATSDGQEGAVTVTVALPPVASITITPAQPAANVGATVQLTATTRDAGGAVLTGRTVTWSSGNTNVATVTNAGGLVTGVAGGSAEIFATSEGVTSSVTVTISAPGSVAIAQVAPALLVEGQAGTITGTGFSATAAQNIVTVDNVAAQVTAATATSLTFTVPSSGCHPARSNAVVRVSVGGDAAQVTHSVRPAAYTTLPVGELTLLSGSAEYCLQLEAGASANSYVFGVQSVSSTGASRTPVTVRGMSGSASGGGAIASSVVAGGGLPIGMDARMLRRARHREAELELRARERTFARDLLARGRTAQGMSSLVMAAVPATVNVGDSVTVKYPNPANLCSSSTNLRTVVRHKGARSIWIEDVDNPANGFTPADYTTLGTALDNQIWNTNTAYFGQPTDLDNNQRIVVVVTKEVNKRQGLLGFVTSADFFPTQCSASNNGEYYYSIAPDPTGQFGAVYSTTDALADAPPLLAHEFTHIIQFGRRVANNANAWPTPWEAEGQATLAEEVGGHAVTGNAPGQNYGAAVVFGAGPGRDWYSSAFIDLALWYGWDGTTAGKVTGAPEECGWLDRPTDADSLGPCLGGRNLYGVSWSFLRWLSDRYGPTFTGGEQGLHRALINDSGADGAGFATIQRVVGQPIDQLLAQWTASLYVDDRFTGMQQSLSFSSWNMQNMYDALQQTGTRLVPRARAFTGFTDNFNVIAGSSSYYTLSGASRPAMSLSIRSQGGGALPGTTRIWIVRTQ